MPASLVSWLLFALVVLAIAWALWERFARGRERARAEALARAAVEGREMEERRRLTAMRAQAEAGEDESIAALRIAAAREAEEISRTPRDTQAHSVADLIGSRVDDGDE